MPFFKVEELIETEQRRRRRETLEEGGHIGGSRNNLEEEARELTRLKEQVENKVSRKKYFWRCGKPGGRVFERLSVYFTDEKPGGRAFQLSGGGRGWAVEAAAGTTGRIRNKLKN